MLRKKNNTEIHINPRDFEFVCQNIPAYAILEPVPKSSSPDSIIHLKSSESIMNLGFQNKSAQVITPKLIAEEVLTFIPPAANYKHTLILIGFGKVDLPVDGKTYIKIPSTTQVGLTDSIYIPPGSVITYTQKEEKKEEKKDEKEEGSEKLMKGKGKEKAPIKKAPENQSKKRKHDTTETNKSKKVLANEIIPNNMEVIVLDESGVEAFFTKDLYNFCSKFLLTRENDMPFGDFISFKREPSAIFITDNE